MTPNPNGTDVITETSSSPSKPRHLIRYHGSFHAWSVVARSTFPVPTAAAQPGAFPDKKKKKKRRTDTKISRRPTHLPGHNCFHSSPRLWSGSGNSPRALFYRPESLHLTTFVALPSYILSAEPAFRFKQPPALPGKRKKRKKLL